MRPLNKIRIAFSAKLLMLLFMALPLMASAQSNEQNITFVDATVKAICVANWDTNHDGELSYAEAASVTDLGEVFKSNEDIKSFNELQYFTGLAGIANQAFSGCRNLISVTIPNRVISIGEYAFKS